MTVKLQLQPDSMYIISKEFTKFDESEIESNIIALDNIIHCVKEWSPDDFTLEDFKKLIKIISKYNIPFLVKSTDSGTEIIIETNAKNTESLYTKTDEIIIQAKYSIRFGKDYMGLTTFITYNVYDKTVSTIWDAYDGYLPDEYLKTIDRDLNFLFNEKSKRNINEIIDNHVF